MGKELRDMTLREIYQKYYSEVKDIAEEIKSEYGFDSVESFQDSDGDKRDNAERMLHESIDGSRWVIMTWQARLVAVTSENVDACENILGEVPEKPEVRAYWAMYQDVMDLLTDEYFYE